MHCALQRFAEQSADPIAIYTLVLAAATIGLWLVTWRMLGATKRSVDLAHQQEKWLVIPQRRLISNI
jgi:hypothetical protein